MNQEFDEWWYAQDFLENGNELTIDPQEAAQLAWAEAYKRATEQAAQICQEFRGNSLDHRLGFMLANLIRQAAEDV